MRLLLPARQMVGPDILAAPLTPMAWLKRAHHWFSENAGSQLESLRIGFDGNGHSTLFIRLHPAAEEVSLVAATEGRVVVAANTSTVGPGYHRYLCELIRKMGQDLDLGWAEFSDGLGDPTGYFETRDVGMLEERMLAWLGSAVEQAIRLRERGQSGVNFSLRYGHAYSHEGAFLTPMGPRDDAWLRAVREDPKRGRDVFPWWGSAQDASSRLGSALIRLWTQMVWRPPLLEEERKVQQEIAKELELAWREDPSLNFPWREWREVLAYLGKGGTLAEEVARRAAEDESPVIGYRRGLVQVTLQRGWSIRIPGSLAESVMGDGSWMARDHRRMVRVVPLEPGAGEAFHSIDEPSLEHRTSRVSSKAQITRVGEGGRLTALSESGSARALCVIQFEDAEDEAFALETWRSLDALPQA